MNKILKVLQVVLIALLLFIQTTSCYASESAVKILTKHQAQFQQGNFSALKALTVDVLQGARDDKKGTLYYGGLLLYFNGEQEKAEIALRRVARTKGTAWAREATRLVVYFMIRSARYNHVKPFLEELLTHDEIRQDLELFYYHAFALFLTREYEALALFLRGEDERPLPKPQWSVTLRQRIAQRHASFGYDLWSALLTMRTNIKDSGALYHALLSHKTEDMLDSTDTFIKRIYSEADVPMPNHIRTVLEAKRALQLKQASAEKAFLSLDLGSLVHSGMIEDLLSIAAKNRRQMWNIMSLLSKARKRATTDVQKAHIDVVLGHLYYEKRYYKNSYGLYKNAFAQKDAYRELPLMTQNTALWRMLSGSIQTHRKVFITTFDEVMGYTKNPKYFVNVLEEYLSVLLQNKEYARLQEDFEYLSKKYSKNYMSAELNRWYFILKRIHAASDDGVLQSSAVDASGVFHRKWSYTSDSPFEYFLYTNDLTKNQFLGSWTISEESATASHIIDETKRIAISETLLEGYFTYGLYDYAYDIIFKNSARVSANIVRKMARYLYQTKNYSRALVLTKRFASESLLFPQTEEDFLFLYPNAMFSQYIRPLTQEPKELAVLYALMREESDFRPSVVSGAGAIGLMQLLPETAADIASRRPSYGDFNLKTPKDNITLGYKYYKYLLRVFKKPVYVFVAYNGGFGNLRKWTDAFDTSDSIVFADSLPFRETRNYMRKLVSSALIYGLLYYDVPSDVMIEYLFQNAR